MNKYENDGEKQEVQNQDMVCEPQDRLLATPRGTKYKTKEHLSSLLDPPVKLAEVEVQEIHPRRCGLGSDGYAQVNLPNAEVEVMAMSHK